MSCCAKPKSSARSIALSRRATRIATAAAKKASKACPAGGCPKPKAKQPSPKQPHPKAAKPCLCGK